MTALDPNRSAQPAEAEILRKLLEGVDTELDMFESRLKRAQSLSYGARQSLLAAQEAVNSADKMTARIENQMSATKEQVEIARGLLHPVRRLPVEVVREIHLQWLHIPHAAADLVPFHAASVCRSWRRVALETPVLWSRPTIRLDLVKQTAYPLDRCVSAWQGRVTAHLSKSPKGSLTITLAGHKKGTPAWIFGPIMQLLASANELHVIECASFAKGDGLYRILTSFMTNIAKVKLSGKLLEADGTKVMTMFAVNLLPNCAHLCSLTLDHWNLSWSTQRSFEALLVLEISNPTLCLEQTSLAALAASMPGLTTLTLRIKMIVEDDESIAEDSLTFERVEFVSIVAAIEYSVTTWLRFPAARHVAIDWVGDGSVELAFEIDLDSILHMFRAEDGSKVARCLGTLDLLDAEFDHSAAMALRNAPELKELRVRHDCGHEEDAETDFWAMLSCPVDLADDRDDPCWIVPKLHTLQVRELCHSYDEDDEERLGGDIESILAMVKARSAAAKECGGPAKLLSVQLETDLPEEMTRKAIFKAMEG